MKHRALGQIDETVRSGLLEAEHRPLRGAQGVQCATAARFGGREVFGKKFGHIQPLPLGRVRNPVANKIAQSLVIGMLKLAAAAGPEMAAGRFDVVWSGCNDAACIDTVTGHGERDMLPLCRDPVTACCQSHDLVHRCTFVHKHAARAPETASASSSGVNAAPHWCAASP